MRTESKPAAMSVPSAAHMMGVSRATVYRLINNGDIESLNIGTRRLVRRDSIERFLDELTKKGGAN